MSRPIIDSDECTACGICVDVCPNSVFELDGDAVVTVNEDACDGASECVEECPMECIEIVED